MSTTAKYAARANLLAAIGVIGAIAFAAPAQAGPIHLPTPTVSGPVTKGSSGIFQTANWLNRSVKKTTDQTVKSAKRAAERQANEKKRTETETGQIRGKIVFEKPKKKTP